MRTIQVKTLQEVRLNGLDEPPGKLVEIDESLLPSWLELGLAELPREKAPNNPSASEVTASDVAEDIEDEIKQYHMGGGHYELPNGEKVKGKESALEALREWKASQGGGVNGAETDNTPDE